MRLDAGIVSELVAAQFPDLAGARVRRFAAGWDHDLFSVGAEWILRFPKRAERVAWLAPKIQINAIAAGTLGSGIPVFERIGTPSAIFPYPFVGYRRLPGTGADQAGARDLGGLADDVGRLLGKLHRIDPRRIPPTPAGWEHDTWAELRTGLAAAGQVVWPLLAPGLQAKAGPYLAGRVREPAQDGPPALHSQRHLPRPPHRQRPHRPPRRPDRLHRRDDRRSRPRLRRPDRHRRI